MIAPLLSRTYIRPVVFALFALGAVAAPPPTDVRPLQTADVHDWTDKYTGAVIYPSQHGIPGWPGLTTTAGNAVRLEAAKQQKLLIKWGYPERLPYPGSVEHVRVDTQRYIPVVPRYNARTLIKNFRATELPGVPAARIAAYAEPVYFVPKYPYNAKQGVDSFDTGLKRAPVKVVRWDSSQPPVALDLGTLDAGVYAVRAIAATPTENVEHAARRLVIGFSVNDGRGGEVTQYRKRCAAIDEFYSVVEFFFIAPERRSYKAQLWIDKSSRIPLLVYNFDLHDRLAMLAKRRGKRSPALYDPAARSKKWAAAKTIVKDARSKEERLAADKAIWDSRLPLNTQGALYSYLPGWEALFRSAKRGIPEGAVDDGLGIDLYGDARIWLQPAEVLQKWKGDWTVKTAAKVGLAAGLTRQTSYAAAWAHDKRIRLRGLGKSVQNYHETGDEQIARAGVISLAVRAMTNMTYGSRQTMSAIDTIPLIGSGHGDGAFRRRRKEMLYSIRGHLPADAASYDYLFPYIQANRAELAESLGRFIPWIKEPADVVRFFDTCLLQFFADQLMSYHQYTDSPTPSWMARVIAVQQDPAIAGPWVEWLFRYVWTYPNIPLGVDELAVNAVGRNGGNRKGSVAYSLSGSFLPSVIADLKSYVAQGGTLPLDMTDPVKFPKDAASREFQHNVGVAGGYTFLIGDVGGPNRARLSYAPPELKAKPENAPKTSSRVLANWFGVLETGLEHSDFRRRRAVGVRVGYGTGHHHDDPLDLQIWAHGVPMCGDGGGRTSYAVPANRAVQSHNTVVSPLATQTSHRWVSSFAPTPGAQYLQAQVKCNGFYGRQVALIDADEFDPPRSYVIDVFRVRGGGNKAPAYAFHGPPADELATNAEDRKPARSGDTRDPASAWEGVAPAKFTATWRMRRDPETITWQAPDGKTQSLKVPGAERQAMNLRALKSKLADDAPRKFIRMHLLGHQGARPHGVRAICAKGEPFTNENLYVPAARWAGETVFPVVLEPFAGAPVISSVNLLTPEATLVQANAPVAIEITLEGGRRDVVVMGAGADNAVEIPEFGVVRAEYAYASFDGRGLRLAVMVGGRVLRADGISISTDAAKYSGTVEAVDYYAKTAVLSRALPRSAVGAVLEIGPAQRRTSYTIEKIEGSKVTFKRGMDFAMSRVREFLPNGVPVLQASIERLEGMTATDDAFQHRWHVGPRLQLQGEASGTMAAAGGSAHPAEMQPWELAIVLRDGPKPAEVLKIGDAVRIWEFGPGDAWRLPTQVSVVRTDKGVHNVNGNITAKIQVGKQGTYRIE